MKLDCHVTSNHMQSGYCHVMTRRQHSGFGYLLAMMFFEVDNALRDSSTAHQTLVWIM